MSDYDKNELFETVGDTMLPEMVLGDIETIYALIEEEIEIAEEDDSFTDADMIEVLVLKDHLDTIRKAYLALQSFLDARGV